MIVPFATVLHTVFVLWVWYSFFKLAVRNFDGKFSREKYKAIRDVDTSVQFGLFVICMIIVGFLHILGIATFFYLFINYGGLDALRSVLLPLIN